MFFTSCFLLYKHAVRQTSRKNAKKEGKKKKDVEIHRWFATENNKGVGVMEVKKVDHIGIAVKSLDEALPFYTDTLGLSCIGIETVESEQVRVAFLKVGDVKLELLEPLSEHSPIASFIEKRGEGIHHVALGVDHIEQRIEELKNNGIRMIHEQPKRGAGGAHIAFMHPKSARGVLYELCEKVGGQ